MDIGPGDWVECIKGFTDGFGNILELGQFYQVLEVKTYPGGGCRYDDCGPTGLLLASSKPCWCRNRFKPIYRPKSEIIEKLKTPIEILV